MGIPAVLGWVSQQCWDRCPRGAGTILKMIEIGGAPRVLGWLSQGWWDGCPKGAGMAINPVVWFLNPNF